MGDYYVFPACAGMFLGMVSSVMVRLRFPRVRGDVPAMESQPTGMQ